MFPKSSLHMTGEKSVFKNTMNSGNDCPRKSFHGRWKKKDFLKMTSRTQGNLLFQFCIAFGKLTNYVMLFPTLNMLRDVCQYVEIFSELALLGQDFLFFFLYFFGAVRKYTNKGGKNFVWSSA